MRNTDVVMRPIVFKSVHSLPDVLYNCSVRIRMQFLCLEILNLDQDSGESQIETLVIGLSWQEGDVGTM